MATSGTAGLTPFTVRDVIEHAARRAKKPPQRLGGEALDVITKLLFLTLSEYVAVGFPLWTKQFSLLPITIGSSTVNTPAGTTDVLNTYWRIFMPYRGAGADQSGNDVSTLFSGQPGPDVTIAGPNPSVIVNFGTATEVDTVGVLLGAQSSFTAALQVSGSADGITYSAPQALPSATYSQGQWVYYDLAPSITAQYLKLTYVQSGSWTLNQVLFGLSNSQNIPNGPFNIDDYYNLPDLSFQSDRVSSCYADRTITPTLRIWPVPDVGAFYNGTISCLSRRYIQDPGAMTNTLEVPVRWYKAVVARLATQILSEISDDMLEPGTGGQDGGMQGYFAIQQQAQLRQTLEQEATKAEAIIWAEERDKLGPIRMTPDISCYTR